MEYIIPSDYTGKMVAAEKLVRCRDCRYWQTGIAYAVTGRCENNDMPEGLICNSNFFCGYGEAK